MKNLYQYLLPADYRVIARGNPTRTSKKVVFIDLDGTLWPDQGPGTILKNPVIDRQDLSQMRAISQYGYSFIGITNQTYFGYKAKVHPLVILNYKKRINSLVRNKILDAVYICHHHPDSKILHLRGNCPKRKPNAGLIDWAIKEFNLNPENSFVVGDRITDIVAAEESNIRRSFLIANPRCLEWNVSNSTSYTRSIQFQVSSSFGDALASIQSEIQ